MFVWPLGATEPIFSKNYWAPLPIVAGELLKLSFLLKCKVTTKFFQIWYFDVTFDALQGCITIFWKFLIFHIFFENLKFQPRFFPHNQRRVKMRHSTPYRAPNDEQFKKKIGAFCSVGSREPDRYLRIPNILHKWHLEHWREKCGPFRLKFGVHTFLVMLYKGALQFFEKF